VTTVFGLLHGGMHGSWCFERLRRALHSRGHETIAVDMAFDDPAVSITEHAEHVATELASHTDVVLVAHSLGGLIAPVVARLRPLRHLILLNAVVPEPGSSSTEQNLDPQVAGPSTLVRDALIQCGNASLRFASADALGQYLYQDCGAAVVRWAWERVVPLAATVGNEVTPLNSWPAVPTTSILGTADLAISPEWGRVAAERIGAPYIELSGASHSPFASRPAELASLLSAIA